MNAIDLYQRLNGTREIPFCSYPEHEGIITEWERLLECDKKKCYWLRSIYPEEIKILVRNRR